LTSKHPPRGVVNNLQSLISIKISWVQISAKTPTFFTGFVIFFSP